MADVLTMSTGGEEESAFHVGKKRQEQNQEGAHGR